MLRFAESLAIDVVAALVASRRYDGVTNVQKVLLADGYVFTAQNEPDIGGTNYWMHAKRFFASKGQAYKVEATAASAEQQANAALFAKSLNDLVH